MGYLESYEAQSSVNFPEGEAAAPLGLGVKKVARKVPNRPPNRDLRNLRMPFWKKSGPLTHPETNGVAKNQSYATIYILNQKKTKSSPRFRVRVFSFQDRFRQRPALRDIAPLRRATTKMFRVPER